uniref:Uncharacterized protein n=1 Tax=Trichobilharzia regenti TaxID=157069 RepID=A0AA85IPU9_TRIRE|nr:unnamed protein product [Trichobilharzia regenti]
MYLKLHSFSLFSLLVIFEFSHTNEYYPKRFITNNSEIHPEPINNDDILDEKYSNLDVPSIHQCPIECFIENDSQELVNCISKEVDTTPSKQPIIPCERNIETGELILGHKESVRGMIPGALGHLLEASSRSGQPLSRSGQLELHINLNMVRLDAKCFQGLGGLVTDVRLLNTVYMHPDSLIDLQHLRSFEIESGQTPLYLPDDNVKSNIQPEEENSVKENSHKPAFIRLHPLDITVPISFNLNTKCHQCVQNDENSVNGSITKPVDNLIVIVFTSKRDLSSTAQLTSPKLSMIFPYTCPLTKDGIGCPGGQSYLDAVSQEEIKAITGDELPSETVSNIPVIEQLKTMTFIQSESNINNTLRLFHVCGRPNSSGEEEDADEEDEEGVEEEVSSNSISSGFFSHRKSSLSKEKSELLSHISCNTTNPINNIKALAITTTNTITQNHQMNDTHSSWSSLHITKNPSIIYGGAGCRCSVISLKDHKSINSNNFNALYSLMQSNNAKSYYQPSDGKHHHPQYYSVRKSHMSKRRSIGSQTDFTDIESDNPESYCTLDRYIMQKNKRHPYGSRKSNHNINDHYLSNRTTSTQLLPYFRNSTLNQMDGIVITKSNLYSNHLLSHSNITMNNTNVNNNSDFHSITDDKKSSNSDLLILMIDGKPKPIRNLPPTNQTYKFSTSVS